MIKGSFVIVCAIFGLVSGSFIEFNAPQDSFSPQVPVPIQTGPSFSAPIVPDNVFSSGYPGFLPSPAVSNNVFSSGPSSLPPVYTPVVSSPISENVASAAASAPVPVAFAQQPAPVAFAQQPAPVVQASGNSLSEILSSGPYSAPISEIIPSGPSGSPITEISSGSSSEPSYEAPVVSTSSQQAPRVISQRFICTKTIVRPEVYQRTVIVPTLQRYLRRVVTPVIENIAYKTTPITQDSSSSPSGAYATALEPLNAFPGTGNGYSYQRPS